MSRREDIDQTIRDVLRGKLDDQLLKQGFVRQSERCDYHRACHESKQSIIFHFEIEPRDDPSKFLLIRPKLQIVMPLLSEVAREITDGNRLILPASDIVIAVPLSPNLIRDVKIGWFAARQEDCLQAIHLGCQGVEDKAVPFMNDLTRPEDLISAFEQKDRRIRFDGRMIIFVASAYLLLNQHEKACKLVQARFGKGAMARHYSHVLEKLCL